MILHTLTLEGVGPYADRQTLDLGRDRNRPVTLVNGLNGSGKTTLIRSLFHVLYGARGLAMIGPRRAYVTFLADAIHTGRRQASLELDLVLPGVREDRLLTVRRRWQLGGRGEDLDVFVEGGYDEELSESWDETIEQVAPLAIARLFFFDGEKIEALADLDAAASSLRTALGALLGLDVIDQVRTDLVVLQRRVLREEKAITPAALEACETALAAAQGLGDDARRRVEDLEQQVADVTIVDGQLLEALRAKGGHLVGDREALEADVAALHASEADAWETLREVARDPAAPLLLVAPLLAALADSAATQERHTVHAEVQMLLQDRDAWLVDELHRLGVTGHDVEQLLEADRARRVGAAPAPAPFAPLTSAAAVRDLVGERAPTLRGAALEAIGRVDDAVARSDDAERRLSRIPSPESVRPELEAVRESRERLEALQAELAAQRQLLAAAEGQLGRARGRRDAELARIATLEDDRDHDRRLVRHAERAKTTLGLLRRRVTERHVGRIAALALECLDQLLHKERLIESLQIDPESFEVTLRGRGGGVLRPDALSAGERQITALSLLWAMARAAGRALPVVIDTPLGRLDSHHRRLVVERYLPSASHQVIVLSTDTEIEDDILYPLLRPCVAEEHRLVIDEDGCTTISSSPTRVAS